MWQGSIHPCPEAASGSQLLFITVTVWDCDLPGLQRSIIYGQVRPHLYTQDSTELYTHHVSRFTLLNKRLIEIFLIN